MEAIVIMQMVNSTYVMYVILWYDKNRNNLN